MSAGAEQSFPLFGFEFRTVLDLIIETLANRVLWSRDLLLSHRLDVAFYLTPTPAVVSRRFHSRDERKSRFECRTSSTTRRCRRCRWIVESLLRTARGCGNRGASSQRLRRFACYNELLLTPFRDER